ncbi:hypothetical protein VTN77DRAFT_2830 [Rasamsonia byssochlamydoides]|uniref:uncharacterized protein n=1 Tax=Rasamsonia byssochlamydoides TaxID=89139 RepID=UPI003742CD14
MSNQGYYRSGYQESDDGRRLKTGMTRTASPVYFPFPRAENNARPSLHTMVQYPSPRDVLYRQEWYRQLEERQSSVQQGYGHHRQQHGNGNQHEAFLPQQQGAFQGQQQHQPFAPYNDQTFDPRNDDLTLAPYNNGQPFAPHEDNQPPFAGQNAANAAGLQQYIFQQNAQQNQFAARSDVCASISSAMSVSGRRGDSKVSVCLFL